MADKKKRENKALLKNALMTLAMRIFLCSRFYLDLLIDKIFGLFYDTKQKCIKPATNPLVLESASNLAKKIRQRQVTVEEVVTAFIDRIKEVNQIINAVVDERFKEALSEAKQIDQDIVAGVLQDIDFQIKPFLGVPFTSKESTACKGMSFTFGLLRRKNRRANFDANIIEKIKRAGGILLGVTNIPQLNLWVESSNPIFGTTNNPYNTTRNVGGSSGGEASIIAACGSPFGIGTDIGGSLRIPSFMCGVYGHKPTSNLISTHGLTFRTGAEKTTMVVAGPMTKYADDLIPLLKVLLDENVHQLRLDEPVKVENLRVFYVKNPKDPFISPLRKEIKQSFDKVVQYFHSVLPEEPKQLYIPEMKYGGKIWRYWMTQEGTDFLSDIVNREDKVNPITEIGKFFIGQSEFNFAVIFSLINTLLPKEKEVWAKETTEKLRSRLQNILGTDGVILYPSAPWPAHYHNSAFLRPWNFNLFAIWNALKFPVTQVPLGLSSDGLPLGIQVVAAPHQDHLCLAVAKALEKEFGGYVPPFERVKKNST